MVAPLGWASQLGLHLALLLLPHHSTHIVHTPLVLWLAPAGQGRDSGLAPGTDSEACWYRQARPAAECRPVAACAG